MQPVQMVASVDTSQWVLVNENQWMVTQERILENGYHQTVTSQQPVWSS